MRRAEPSGRRRNRIPLPAGLAICIALLILEAAQPALLVSRAEAPFGIAGALAAVVAVVVLAAGLYAHRGWARLGGAVALTALLALRLLGTPITILAAMSAGLLLFGIWYLLSRSTARLFEATSSWSVDATGLLVFGLLATASLALGALAATGVPSWQVYALGVAAGGGYALLGRRLPLAQRLRSLWVGPEDLSREQRPAFRAALRAYYAGRLDAAAARLRDLPERPSVSVLASLVRFETARRGVGLERIVSDASWAPHEPAERAALLEGRDRKGVLAVVENRTGLIDALVADSSSARPVFGSELSRVIGVCTGTLFVTNADQQIRDWWSGARAGLEGEAALEWLTLRLWDASCAAAAERVAGWRGDPRLEQAAQLVGLMAEWPPEDELEGWLTKHAEPLAVVPDLAEGIGLLLVGSRFVAGAGPARIANRVRSRVPLLERVAALWQRYAWEAPVEAPGMVWLLAGRSPRSHRRGRFERWWLRERQRLVRFDEQLAAGLEWATLDEWAQADRAFRDAAEADQERSSPIYNRAFSLIHLDRPTDAEPLLRELVEREPKEALWWLRLGDALRLQNRNDAAIRAYAEAQQRVGEPDQFVSLRLAVCQLRLGRESEAEQTVVAAFGPDAGGAPRDQWETLLEADDAAWLAARYTMAVSGDDLHAALDGGLVDGEDDDDDEPPPTVH